MLRHTFIHGHGIGPQTEETLWRSGALTWEDFLDLHGTERISGSRLDRLAPLIRRSQTALRKRAIEFFSDRLPSGEQWRLYPDFSDQVAFIDIETTGLVPGYDEITVIGLYDHKRFLVFIRGKNLREFPRVISRYSLLVSYNGAQFDMPFLRATFPGFRPRAHLDLRYPLARLGYTGGLKLVERKAGIRRPRSVRELDGFDAVILWHEYQRGKRSALDRLISYTRQDVTNLLPLAELVAEDMPRRLRFPGPTSRR
jgi:uncharacterized protein YprB with RNaseH-like and TPR domain